MFLDVKLPREKGEVSEIIKDALKRAGKTKVNMATYDIEPPFDEAYLDISIYCVVLHQDVATDTARKVTNEVMLPFRPTWEVARFHAWIESKRIPHAIEFLDVRPDLIDSENDYGCTPIHTAAIWDSTLLINELYGRGADLDHLDCEGNTALIDAVECGHIISVKLLIELGANILVKNRKGKSALDTARSEKFPEIVKFLEKKMLSIH